MINILIRGFPSLDNYGTGMMGLIAIDRLTRLIDGPVRFLCDFKPTTDIAQIMSELGESGTRAEVVRHVPRPLGEMGQIGRRVERLRRHFLGTEAAGADLVVVLGGDDLSEYYVPDIWRRIGLMRRWSEKRPVVLLGQTIGPFNTPRNRQSAKEDFPHLHIFARDKWTMNYLTTQFGLKDRLYQGSDLAYMDLPLQGRTDIEQDILARYGLAPDTYATLVISGLQQNGYYTDNPEDYRSSWIEIIRRLLAHPGMAGRKLCLLAHTFSSVYGNEPDFINDLMARLPEDLKDRITPVTEKVLQARARFILGNGLFTITGRMHPAVSTFQMGKPAISLAYGSKYEGVIGTMLGRSDLIVDADHAELWASRRIADLTMERVDLVLANHSALCTDIRERIAEQKQVIEACFRRVYQLLPARS
ncbi:polysaccharide pyruvyl transferase family protein [Sandaracinobacteroides hominis]|uniref:polysaccharide pyruvyl transferase family protein n=1 Tax=Sandaracinobacteroides hominis TaxID=2780086 RepID=UPI0018F286EA|nr:polysaccharide pyruvyl transferase family protein [Sandaracinobacteroides hominis]